MRKLKIETKRFSKLTRKELETMNGQRIKDYGKKTTFINKKEDGNATFTLVREDGKLMAWGAFKPIGIDYLGKKYRIFAMGRGMAVIKGTGYGRALNDARIHQLKKNGKTAVAFTSRKNMGFFKKVGFELHKNFIRRFAYRDTKTGEITYDPDGDGVCYDGKDGLIKKMVSTKGIAYMDTPFW